MPDPSEADMGPMTVKEAAAELIGVVRRRSRTDDPGVMKATNDLERALDPMGPVRHMLTELIWDGFRDRGEDLERDIVGSIVDDIVDQSDLCVELSWVQLRMCWQHFGLALDDGPPQILYKAERHWKPQNFLVPGTNIDIEDALERGSLRVNNAEGTTEDQQGSPGAE